MGIPAASQRTPIPPRCSVLGFWYNVWCNPLAEDLVCPAFFGFERWYSASCVGSAGRNLGTRVCEIMLAMSFDEVTVD